MKPLYTHGEHSLGDLRKVLEQLNLEPTEFGLSGEVSHSTWKLDFFPCIGGVYYMPGAVLVPGIGGWNIFKPKTYSPPSVFKPNIGYTLKSDRFKAFYNKTKVHVKFKYIGDETNPSPEYVYERVNPYIYLITL